MAVNLDELIYKRLSENESIVKRMATFKKKPAIFTPEPPKHDTCGWSRNHFPMIVFNYNLQANSERNSVGTLEVTLICDNSSDTPIEEIEKDIKDCLRDVIMFADSPFAFSWARSDGFTIDDKQGMTIGTEIRFDILEFPEQITTEPDPIMAVNRYIKEIYPDFMALGYDRHGDVEEATKERPIFYCELKNIVPDYTTFMVAWQECQIAVHVMCPDKNIRMKMSAAIAQKMSVDGEINMFDDSPMFIMKQRLAPNTDYLQSGQVIVNGKYGVLRQTEQKHIIQHIYTDDKWKEQENGKQRPTPTVFHKKQ